MATIEQPEAPAMNPGERAHQRLMELARTDPQIAAAVPDPAVLKAMQEPGLGHREVIAAALAGYRERPALGMRAYELRDDGAGRKVRHHLPSFTTITYGELAQNLEAIAGAWQHHPRRRVAPGEFVALIAFASTEMVTMDMACAYAQAVSIPLQANLPDPDMMGILTNTGPAVLVATIDNLELAAGYALRQPTVRSLIAIDYDPAVDEERETFAAVAGRLAADGDRVALTTFAELVAYGADAGWTPPPRPAEGLDALAMLMHTSGSTGTPKGAMIHEGMCINIWNGMPGMRPTIHVVAAPLNHFMGRSQVFGALAAGGTAFFTLKSDMSTLLEDIRIARPTSLMLFPRIAEIIHQTFQSEVLRRLAAGGGDRAAIEAEVRAEMRGSYLGDRLLTGGLAGSPSAPEVKDFMRDCFDIALTDGYSSTEAGTGAVMLGGQIQRSFVDDWKLLDVPELGYYGTDKPWPRGELLLKTRFQIKGYYKRPDANAAVFDEDGWLHTGDIMEQFGPNQIRWIGRRNNVLKLSQGEYVALNTLEASFVGNVLIKQIYIYGNSYRSFLLAVVVPEIEIARMRLGHEPSLEELRTMVLAELQEVARTAGLKSFEVPRDVLIERDPFTHENGLLSSVRKPLHPKLKERYRDALEAIYAEIDRKQKEELVQLRNGVGGLSTLQRVAGAFKANLGLASIDPQGPESYGDLGGDSLGAVALSLLIEDIFGVAVPVSVLLDPSGSVGRVACYVENARKGDGPDFASVHGKDAESLRAADLTLDAFLDAEALAAAATAAPPAPETRTVLLTGVTGFLGRFLALEWLEAMAATGGKVICLVRAADAAAARARIDEAIGTLDPDLATRFQTLADKHIEVLPGDLAAPRLGLDEATFARLGAEVDQIVHPGALVNHLLSYRNLFEPNVVGTAELLRLALTGRQKRFDYVSTFGVPQMAPGLKRAPEDTDVREKAPEIPLREGYAAGYGASKWASEVLLREAHDHFGLPVTVYRPDMIMAHSRYRGQLNLPDMFTRLLLSLAVTGIAPESFHEPAANGGRARVHYDGMPVDFLAAAIRALGSQPWQGFRTFNTISAHIDDGVSLDTIADWVATAGYPLERIADHADWARRFAERMRNLPDDQRQHSALPVMGYVERPHAAEPAGVRNDAFVAAVRSLPGAPEVPALDEAFIHKYLDDLRLLGVLPVPPAG